MYVFITGSIADIDLTTTAEPLHPSLVLVVDSGVEMQSIIVPNALLKRDIARFKIGTTVRVVARAPEGLDAGGDLPIAQSVVLL
jgi:hypothetical protein